MPYARSKCGSACSMASLVCPYALIGAVGCVSRQRRLHRLSVDRARGREDEVAAAFGRHRLERAQRPDHVVAVVAGGVAHRVGHGRATPRSASRPSPRSRESRGERHPRRRCRPRRAAPRGPPRGGPPSGCRRSRSDDRPGEAPWRCGCRCSRRRPSPGQWCGSVSANGVIGEAVLLHLLVVPSWVPGSSRIA